MVEAHLARIEAVNPVINAVVARRYAEARVEADAADARVAAATDDAARAALPPYLGVPCTIKECFALSGMPQSSGLVARKDFIAGDDAITVARLRAAGAIPLGVTNVSELCMWYESNNRVYGRTNNPYDPSRIVGGSSGGEGAIIGAGGSPFGLGSDVGGSIRMPAFFNGVFGHKPTGGLVPGSGQYPAAHGESTRIVATGPLCRRADDLWPLVQILAGPDGLDEGATAMALGDPAVVRLDRLTVLDVEDNGLNPVHRELKVAQARVAEALARAGARIRRVRFPSLRRSFDIWSSTLVGCRRAVVQRAARQRQAHPRRARAGQVGGAPLAPHAAGDRPGDAGAGQRLGAGPHRALRPAGARRCAPRSSTPSATTASCSIRRTFRRRRATTGPCGRRSISCTRRSSTSCSSRRRRCRSGSATRGCRSACRSSPARRATTSALPWRNSSSANSAAGSHPSEAVGPQRVARICCTAASTGWLPSTMSASSGCSSVASCDGKSDGGR